MKKFKRSLCLVLVLAFVVGLCSAGITASASNFTDDDEILYKDQVDVLAGLGVLVGYPEGDFKPTDAVTRAEAVKIVAYIVLGPSAASKLTVVNERFKDVPVEHWASAYIDWGCANPDNPILKGYGDGNFGPSDNVTIAQFSKMLLVALGYGYKGEFTATDWINNTMSIAAQNDFFKGYVDVASLMEVASSSKANRQECSLISFNAMFANFINFDKSANSYSDVIDKLAIKNVSKIISLLDESDIIDIVNNSNGVKTADGEYLRSPASLNFGFNPIFPFWATKTDGLAWITASTFASQMEVLEVLGTSANISHDFPFGFNQWGDPRELFMYDGEIIAENTLEPLATYETEVQAKEIYADLLEAGMTAQQIKEGQRDFHFGSYVDGMDVLLGTVFNITGLNVAAWDFYPTASVLGFAQNTINKDDKGVGATGEGVLTKAYGFTDYWGKWHTVITSVNTFLGDIDKVNTKDGKVDVGGFDPWSQDMMESTPAAAGYEATGYALDDVVNFNYSVMLKNLSSWIELYSFLLTLNIDYSTSDGISIDNLSISDLTEIVKMLINNLGLVGISASDIASFANAMYVLDDAGIDLDDIANLDPDVDSDQVIAAAGTVMAFLLKFSPSIDVPYPPIFGLQNLELAKYEDGTLDKYNLSSSGARQLIVGGTQFDYNTMWVIDAGGYDSLYGHKGDTVRLYFDKYDNVLSLNGSVMRSNYALLLDARPAAGSFANKYLADLYILNNDGSFDEETVYVSADTYAEIKNYDDNLLSYVDYQKGEAIGAPSTSSDPDRFTPSIVRFSASAAGEANTVLLTDITTNGRDDGKFDIQTGIPNLLFKPTTALPGDDFDLFSKASNNTYFVMHDGKTPLSIGAWKIFDGIDAMDDFDKARWSVSFYDHYNTDTNHLAHIVWLFPAYVAP